MNKNSRQILIGISFVAIVVSVVFLINYYQEKKLFDEGTKCKAVITGRFYEVSSSNDTSGYSLRMIAVPDTSTNKGRFLNGDVLTAYVKMENFYKYEEGSIASVVYDVDDKDHARLIDEVK